MKWSYIWKVSNITFFEDPLKQFFEDQYDNILSQDNKKKKLAKKNLLKQKK